MKALDYFLAQDFLAEVDLADVARALEAEKCERSLYAFLRAAWPHFDPAPFTGGWHLEAICEHLEAVSNGEIRKLLINIPPRMSKTSAVAIAWPVWTWALRPQDGMPLRGPGVRFLCASYGANKAQQDAVTARRLIASPWFQSLWGDRVRISKSRDNQEQYDTEAGGSRISTGIPESLGKGGVIRMIDDPHKTDEVESDLIRDATIRAYDEVWRTRSNDPKAGAEVIIMQRLGERDLSGHVLEDGDWCHLMLPLEYDSRRHCSTVIGFEDPRGCGEDGELLSEDERQARDGALLWPERFGQDWVQNQKLRMGPFAWSGQMQQAPAPRGGGVIKEEWWQLWAPSDFPPFGTVVVSLDGAYTEKEINDPSACTVWAAFEHPEAKRPKVMLRAAWRERLGFAALVEKLGRTCQECQADVLLIEGKGPGISVAQEMRRLFGGRQWQTVLITPKGDKMARLVAVEPLFAGGLIYAPDTTWAQLVIDEVLNFPKGRYRDLTDSTSQALQWLRQNGVVLRKEEHEEQERELRRYRRPVAAAYDV